jgi:RNA polymerase sigma factor (TIGR02999 family)
MSNVVRILERAQAGDPAAAQEILPLVYEELRRLASHRMASEAPGRQTLQPTALVHEAWLRLGGAEQPVWQNRAHFFAAAGEAMRRILIDRARKRQVREPSGLAHPEELHESQVAVHSPSELLAVHEALDDLAAVDATAAQLVKLRCFVGMTLPEAAEALGMALRSAERLWSFSRAWLRDRLRHGGG